MKLATVRSGTDIVPGVIDEDRFSDISSTFADLIEVMGLAMTEDGRDEIARAADAAPTVALSDVEFMPPILNPRRILCVGTNYHAHVAESDRVVEAPGHPMIFTRFPSSLVGHGQAIERPPVSTSFDYEGELAIVIGRSTRYAERGDALGAIAGYSCLMDGTLRDYQRHTSQFTPGKNFERSGSWGPWIVTADEVGDPYDLTLTTTLDGEQMQSASTTQLIFDIEAIVAYCSTFTTLEPGDVIATGTPGGVGYAQDPPRWLTPGAEISVSVPGVGTLTNPVVDEQ